MAGETAEVTRTIEAPPDEVWAVVGDVTRLPAWSEDLDSVEVLQGDGRSPGSRFRGNNRDGRRSWSMTCVIDRYDEGRALELHTEDASGAVRTRWWYRLEPDGGGTLVTEGFLRVAALGRVRALAERVLVGDRVEVNRRNMEESLRRLAALVERR